MKDKSKECCIYHHYVETQQLASYIVLFSNNSLHKPQFNQDFDWCTQASYVNNNYTVASSCNTSNPFSNRAGIVCPASPQVGGFRNDRHTRYTRCGPGLSVWTFSPPSRVFLKPGCPRQASRFTLDISKLDQTILHMTKVCMCLIKKPLRR